MVKELVYMVLVVGSQTASGQVNTAEAPHTADSCLSSATEDAAPVFSYFLAPVSLSSSATDLLQSRA